MCGVARISEKREAQIKNKTIFFYMKSLAIICPSLTDYNQYEKIFLQKFTRNVFTVVETEGSPLNVKIDRDTNLGYIVLTGSII